MFNHNTGQFDLWIRKEGDIFKITEYPFGQFGKNGNEKSFKSIDELNIHLKKYVPSFSHLERKKIIQHEKDGGYKMDAEKYKYRGKHIIISKSAECPFTSQYGANGSSPATFEAIKKWLR